MESNEYSVDFSFKLRLLIGRESGRDFDHVKWVLKGLKRVKHGGIRIFYRAFTPATGVHLS